MFDIHLTPELLHAVARGEFPLDLFHRLMLAHAVRVSPRARRELDRWRFERPGAEVVGQISGGRYGDVFERLGGRLGTALEVAEKQRSQADLELAELGRLQPGERARIVQRSRRRFRSPALAEGALAAAWSDLPVDLVSAGGWAEIAFWAGVRLDTDPRLRETLATEIRLRAQALGCVVSQLDDPGRCLLELEGIRVEARRALGHAPEVEAELGVLEALVLRRQGLDRRAAESLRRALGLLEELDLEERPWIAVADRELAALAAEACLRGTSIRS